MKRIALRCLMTLALIGVPLSALPASGVPVEILYMNHGPLQQTVKEIREICSQHGNKIAAAWYDFESPAGEQFKTRKGIRQHVPLVIWIDGRSNVSVNGKEVQFVGFPAGSGPAPFQGKWTMDDLRRALDEATHKK